MGGEVGAVLRERVEGPLGVGRVDLATTAQLWDGRLDRGRVQPEAAPWSDFANASSRWSVETKESPIAAMRVRADSSTPIAARDSPGAETLGPEADGILARAVAAAWEAAATDDPAACSRAGVVVSDCSVGALSRWAGSVCGCPAAVDAGTAAERASCAFVVS